MNPLPSHACPLCGSADTVFALTTQDFSVSQEIFQLWDCRACGVRFTHPAPVPDRIGVYYQSEEYVSHSDTRKGIINQLYHLARNLMLTQKRKLVEAHATPRRLLDVGCGTGYFLHHLQAHGFETLGVEADEKARAFAQTRFGLDVRPPGELEEGALCGPFGAATMWHVLEHIHEPQAYLQRIAALLGPEGALIIAVPNFTSYDGAYYDYAWAAYDVPRHLWHFKPSTLIRLVEAQGFSLIKKAALPLDPFYVALLSERYKGSGLPGMLRAGMISLASSWRSWRNVEAASSVVYIFRKL